MAEDGVRKLRVVEGSGVGPGDLVREYLATLGGRSVSTVEAYRRILCQLAAWVAERPGGSSGFRPELLTRTAVEGSNLVNNRPTYRRSQGWQKDSPPELWLPARRER